MASAFKMTKSGLAMKMPQATCNLSATKCIPTCRKQSRYK